MGSGIWRPHMRLVNLRAYERRKRPWVEENGCRTRNHQEQSEVAEAQRDAGHRSRRPTSERRLTWHISSPPKRQPTNAPPLDLDDQISDFKVRQAAHIGTRSAHSAKYCTLTEMDSLSFGTHNGGISVLPAIRKVETSPIASESAVNRARSQLRQGAGIQTHHQTAQPRQQTLLNAT
jgi:hypothetical protein